MCNHMSSAGSSKDMSCSFGGDMRFFFSPMDHPSY